jgi:hypothetical protein
MEEVCKRFPGLAEDVIAKIDPQSLTRFKESSRGVSEFLDKGKCLWKRMILENISGNFQQHISKKHFTSLYNVHHLPLVSQDPIGSWRKTEGTKYFRR